MKGLLMVESKVQGSSVQESRRGLTGPEWYKCRTRRVKIERLLDGERVWRC
jgi:hypothetical protein